MGTVIDYIPHSYVRYRSYGTCHVQSSRLVDVVKEGEGERRRGRGG